MSEDEKKEYVEATKEEATHRPNDEKQGLQEPRVKSYNPLQVGFIVFVILVLILVGFGIGTDWFGILD